MSHKGARYDAPVDWSDPDQAATQARIDVLRNMISVNPMSYSEKEMLVRQRLAAETRSSQAATVAKEKKPPKNWDI